MIPFWRTRRLYDRSVAVVRGRGLSLHADWAFGLAQDTSDIVGDGTRESRTRH